MWKPMVCALPLALPFSLEDVTVGYHAQLVTCRRPDSLQVSGGLAIWQDVSKVGRIRRNVEHICSLGHYGTQGQGQPNKGHQRAERLQPGCAPHTSACIRLVPSDLCHPRGHDRGKGESPMISEAEGQHESEPACAPKLVSSVRSVHLHGMFGARSTPSMRGRFLLKRCGAHLVSTIKGDARTHATHTRTTHATHKHLAVMAYHQASCLARYIWCIVLSFSIKSLIHQASNS